MVARLVVLYLFFSKTGLTVARLVVTVLILFIDRSRLPHPPLDWFGAM